MLRVPIINTIIAIGMVFASLGVIAPVQCTAADGEDGFETLFDGETLKGWDGDPKLWNVVDGVIRGQTHEERPIDANQFLIWDGEVDDFTLRLQFRIADRGIGNSGVQYRSRRQPDAGKWVIRGYQADIERSNKYMGILYEERGRGILALRGEEVVLEPSPNGLAKKVIGSVGDPAEIVRGVRPGEWQDLEITAQGNDLVHKLNGVVAVHVTDQDSDDAAHRGLLALQLHRGPAMQIEFRSIRLKRLTPRDPSDTK
jgi:hypothetical protein